MAVFERDNPDMASLYTWAGDALRWVYDRRIDTPALLDAEHYFPNAARFAERWELLRHEALAIAGMFDRIPRFHEIMREQADISANDGRDWRMFVMKAYGHVIQENLACAPALAAILVNCPEVLSATYSYLAPGKHVPKHRGPFRGILRFHLGLSMPRDARGNLGNILWINGIPHLLDDGQSLLWDDTYPHELLNMTDQVRVVLLLDIWRPEMPADMAALSKAVVGGMRAICRANPQAFAA